MANPQRFGITMPAFQYEALNLERPSIRILQLYKGLGPEISGCMHHACFDDREILIPYEALSYTWGSLDLTHYINIQGRRLRITSNLYVALQHLRLPDQDRILWVDAVCINQSDLNERGHQVRQMAQIYKESERVVIWLGEGTDRTDILMESLKRLQQASNALSCKTWNLEDPAWKHLWGHSQINPQQGVPGLENTQRQGLEEMLSRSWFRRVWVLQEVAHARRGLVQCGSKSVRASYLALASALMSVKVNSRCKAVLDIMPGISRDGSWWSKIPDLYTILRKFRDSEASDSRDRIYALLGLVPVQNLPGDICPDYTKSSAGLRRDLCQHLFSGLVDPTDSPEDSIETFLDNLQTFNDIALGESLSTPQSTTKLKFALSLMRRGDFSDENALKFTTELFMLKEKRNRAYPYVLWGNISLGSFFQAPVDKEQNPFFSSKFDKNYFMQELVLDLLHKSNLIHGSERQMNQTSSPDAVQDGPEDREQIIFTDLFPAISFDINNKDSCGRYVLSTAASYGCHGVVQFLLKHRANIDSKDKDGRTALLWASINGHETTAQTLLENGANVHLADNQGLTPLSFAATLGRESLVMLLLDYGSRRDHADLEGMTPLSRAARNGHETVVRRLLNSAEPGRASTYGLHLA